MNISKPFIERPVATTVLMLSFIIFGSYAYRFLPISELPNVDFPTIVVSASLPGADPDVMATTVAMPLEKQFSTIAGIDSMNSVNSVGQTQITLQFSLDRNIDGAAQDVQSAISQASKQLPPQMTTPPIFKKVNPALAPILFFAVTADHLPLAALDDYAQVYIAEQLSMIPGIAEVDVYGSQQYAVRIRVNPNALANRNLGLDTIESAINALTTNQPSGILETQGDYHLLKVDGQLNNAAAFNEAIIAGNNDAIVRLKDVGTALDSVVNNKIATWYNNDRAIMLAIQRQPGANTVKIVENVFKKLPSIVKQIPGKVNLNVLYDRSVFIKNSIQEVKHTLILAVILVLFITYLFFNNIASTFITALDFPTSIIATFGIMYLLSYSIDNLSLMALVLAVGFVIDDTIVVLENILRHMEKGIPRYEAAVQATKEIGFTVLSMTLSLAAVFIPILFMGGVLGRLFHEFAVVVGSAILFSGFVALTLTPMLRSRFLSVNADAPKNIVVGSFSKYFDLSKQLYEKSLAWVFDNTKIVWTGVLVIILLTSYLFYIVPKGFIPSQDTGIIFGTTQVQEGLNFSEFARRQQQVAKIASKNPDVESLISTVGQGSGAVRSNNGGQIFLRLKPFAERRHSADQIIDTLRNQINQVPGIKVILQNPPAIRIGGTASSSYQYVLQGSDLKKLQQVSLHFQDEISKISGITDVNSDLFLNNPEFRIHILRDKAAQLGITPAEIENILYLAYGGAQINTLITAINQYPVLLEVDPKYQMSINELKNIRLKSTAGTMVPLSAVAEITEGVGALSVNHFAQLPAVTLSFGLKSGTSLGEVTQKIETLAKKQLPSDIIGFFSGVAQTFQQSLVSLPLLLFFTIIVIYMILAILYEHFIHPITILTALPFAAFGALLALFIFRQELDIFSFIGIIMLVGLVKKNGIILIDFALEEKRQTCCTPKEAILKACLVRYRPIMMTTFAAIFSVLPLAIGFGVGAETRRPLGIAVVGGLIFSQLLTLYITPLFYVTMENWTARFLQFCKKHSPFEQIASR